ncbi:MAG: type I-E CRISPR-associated protein Cas7/Cse4/CasC [Dehalococcoidales bacterium]|nr:type I-E CRISPR-associated protein Cas7/Cse4/CasC [Dehalococcoidales bacterium]
MIIELHILQNFAPSNLNRDDTNSPKECEFGGYRRARVSSQCIKRSIREYFKNKELVPLDELAKRTNGLVKELTGRLVKVGKLEADAKQASINAITATDKLKLKDKEKTEYLLFLGEKEIRAVVDIILSNWSQLTAKSPDKKQDEAIGKSILEALNGGKAIDLALFGRMLADLPGKNVDAASQVAHAISTHKVGVEFDFYTAVDDLQTEAETGAGMMGTIEFNSACFYRYANINCAQLKKNLGGDQTLTQQSVEAFIRAAVHAIPSGKQNSFAAQNPPSFVFAVARKSGAWSLANAFAKPVWVGENGDLIEQSTKELVDYWSKLGKAYGDKDILTKPAYTLGVTDLKSLDAVDGLEQLISKINQATAADC